MSGEEWKAVKEQVEAIATEVVAWGRTTDVIYSLLQQKLLTEANMAHLMSLNTKKEQVRQLVALLAASGSGSSSSSSLRSFLGVLQEQGMENLVKCLDPDGNHSPEPLSQDPSAFSGLRVTPFQHHLQQWAGGASNITTLPGHPNFTFPNPGQDITNNNENDNLNANTPMDTHTASPSSSASPRTPLKISVVPCREIGGKHFLRNEVYNNESEPRGYVFLANYKNFLDEQHETRSGSEIDVQNLCQLFSQMGYKPSYHINMTKWETIQALRDFRNMKEHSNVDSCIVVFMSHGRDDTSFYTSDNHYLTVHNVVERFNNRECPILKGKPKIFIFQFCRGVGPDIGVDAANVSHVKSKGNSNGLDVETDSSTFGSTVPERDPTYTDMYIVYSTVGGFVSFRHPESGSWLVEAICEVFMKDACDTELEHLMKKVSRRVRANFSTEGNKQACEFVQRAFDRHFFFNPKPLPSLSSLNLSQLGEMLPRLKPVHHRRIRTSSPSSKLKSGNACGGARRRHFSGENSTSENHLDDLDVLDNSKTPALHPRVKSLSTSYRRKSASEVPNQNLFHGMTRGHSFSELNSGGSSPEPSETSELGATSCFSLERLSSLEDPQQQCSNAGFQVSEACGGSSRELHPDLMVEASPLESPKEGFPLIHSQSALEAIAPSEFGGVTGVGPEVRGAEELRPSFKRQLSVPSNNETLQKVNDVRRYLQLNDSDEALLHPLKRIESFINKKKREGKRRKMGESNSQEY
ncbi:uncharacterized protein LOC135115726 isoform X3 [Scylla paramamosain]